MKRLWDTWRYRRLLTAAAYWQATGHFRLTFTAETPFGERLTQTLPACLFCVGHNEQFIPLRALLATWYVLARWRTFHSFAEHPSVPAQAEAFRRQCLDVRQVN